MRCYFIELLFPLFVGEFYFPEESGGKCRRVTLIHEPDRPLGCGDQPFGKFPDFPGLGAIPTVAVEG